MARKYHNTGFRQQQIIEAARRLIIKYGSEHLTVGRIAKEVRLSEGAIYRHFKSKSEILSFLLDQAEHDLLGGLGLERLGNQASLKEILGSLKKQLSAIESRRGSSFQVIAEVVSFGDRKLNRKASEIINKYISGLKDLLSRGVRSGEVSEDVDLEAAATILFGMTEGLVNSWALSDYTFSLTEKHMPLWQTFRRLLEKR